MAKKSCPHKNLLWTACVIFGVAGAVHLSRIFLRFSLNIGGWAVPLWLNFCVGLILVWLSWMCGMAAKN